MAPPGTCGTRSTPRLLTRTAASLWSPPTRRSGDASGNLTLTPTPTLTPTLTQTLTRDASGNVIIEGLSQHANPFFYLALVVMVATAVAQVKYLNLGMSLFGNSEV